MPPISQEQAAHDLDRQGARLNRRLTVEAAADYLGLSVPTLNRLRGTGGGPNFLKLGARRIAYDTRDLELWLASCRRSSTSAAEAI